MNKSGSGVISAMLLAMVLASYLHVLHAETGDVAVGATESTEQQCLFYLATKTEMQSRDLQERS